MKKKVSTKKWLKILVPGIDWTEAQDVLLSVQIELLNCFCVSLVNGTSFKS